MGDMTEVANALGSFLPGSAPQFMVRVCTLTASPTLISLLLGTRPCSSHHGSSTHSLPNIRYIRYTKTTPNRERLVLAQTPRSLWLILTPRSMASRTFGSAVMDVSLIRRLATRLARA